MEKRMKMENGFQQLISAPKMLRETYLKVPEDASPSLKNF